MRIASNSVSARLVSQLQTLTSQQSILQNQISTGQSITNPSDNPTSYGSVLNIEAQKQQLTQYASNNNQATSISTAVSSALTSLQTLSSKAAALANGVNGTTNATGFSANVNTLNQMINSGLQTLNSQYAGANMFGGTQTSTPPFTAAYDASGNVTGVTYNGTASAAAIPVAVGTTVTPTTDGATNQKMADFINNLVTLRDACVNQSATAVTAAIPAIHTSEDNVIQAVGTVGAAQTTLQALATQNATQFQGLNSTDSSLTSTNIAQTVVQLTQAQTSYQAALSSSSKIMNMSLLNYLPASA